MFSFFSKTLRQAKADLRKTSKGQVAIILILMTALAIIVYAATLNLGRVAELKTLTTIAADVSAAQMASHWASHAEQLYQVTLGGEGETKSLTVCGLGPTVQLLISTFLVIVAIVIFVVGCVFAACTPSPAAIAILAVALALSIGALLLQILVLDPGITRAWEKLMENMEPIDQFIERGITAGLQQAVNDPILVADMHDSNNNGLFGKDDLGIPRDLVSRFGLYYTRRLQKMEITVNPAVKEFKKELTTFIDSFWEITNCSVNPADPCCGADPPAECNPCCQPLVNPITGRPIRPTCCDGVNPSFDSCGSSANCNASSEYGPAYPPRYDPYYEKFPNSSFRGTFGLDDEHRFFHTNPLQDHSRPQVLETDMHVDSDGVSRKIFRFDDVKSTMVFPVFWKFSDWGVDLGQLTLDPNDNYKKYECHACDFRFPPAYQQCNDISPLLSLPGTLAGPSVSAGGLSPQLSLPNAPGNYNGGNCVFDPRDPRDQSPKKIIRPDMVKTIEDLIVFPESNYATDCGLTVGKWKRGLDLYCSTTWPYSLGCEKSGGYNCTGRDGNPIPCTFFCGDPQAGNPAMWPDDPFDAFMISSKDFAIWAQNLSEMDDATAARDFKFWYPEFLNWLSPTPSGEVMKWRDLLQIWSNRINNWLNVASFRGSDCDEALCFPPASMTGIPNAWPTREVGTPAGQCPGLKQSETAIFGNGTVNDVLNCLDYNISNISKFSACGADPLSCIEVNCSNLPRSVLVNAGVSGADYFDTNDFVVPRQADEDAFLACLNSSSFTACGNNCTKPPLPTSPTPWQGPTKGPVIPQYDVASATFTPLDVATYNRLLTCRTTTCPAWRAPCDSAYSTCTTNRTNCKSSCDTTWTSCKANCGPLPKPKTCAQCDTDKTNCYNSCDATWPCEANYDDCYNPRFCEGYQCRFNVDINCDSLCQPNHSVCIANCAGQPSLEATQSCYASCNSVYDGCISGCSTFQAALNAAQGTCFQEDWNLGNQYYWSAARSWMLAKGSCLDKVWGFSRTASDGLNYTADWQPKLQLAAIEAQNQVVKLQKRRDFLAARAVELRNMKNFFDSEIVMMNTLLEAAQRVIDAQTKNRQQHSLPGFAIYGWQGEKAPNATRGQWHIVRVDVREPGRCNGNCGKIGGFNNIDPKTGKWLEPDLPTIKTYTLPCPSWLGAIGIGPPSFIPGVPGIPGCSRCFSLGDVFDRYSGCDEGKDYGRSRRCFKGGVVKAQVIRWDENQNQLTFPGGFNLWKFIFSHPLAAGGVPSANDLDSICPSLDDAPGAFMLNRPPDDTEDHKCWDKVNRLLKHGVASKACAEYYYHDKTPRGFNLKFSNCPPAQPGDI